MKEDYTLREILFGLRDEQLRIEKELYLLEKMLTIYGNERYQGSTFLSIRHDYQSLYYNLMINYTLREKIYNLFFGDNLFDFKGIALHTTLDKDGKHVIMYDRENLVKHDLVNDFDKKVDALLTDRFVNETYVSNRQKNYYLYINYAHLLYNEHDYKMDSFIQFKYFPKSDSIHFSTTKKYKNKYLNDLVNERLEKKIPRSLIPENLQRIIDNNEKAKKEVLVRDQDIREKKGEFYINDERDSFVLVKKI